MLFFVNWTIRNKFQWNFNKKYNTFHWWICIWKYRLWIGSQFVLGEDELNDDKPAYGPQSLIMFPPGIFHNLRAFGKISKNIEKIFHHERLSLIPNKEKQVKTAGIFKLYTANNVSIYL